MLPDVPVPEPEVVVPVVPEAAVPDVAPDVVVPVVPPEVVLLVVPAADPTGGVTTVVTPDASVAGMTTAVLAAPEPAVPVGVTTFCDWLDWPEAEGVAGEPAPPRVPSGSTQFTSRCVQKSGMLVRLVESAPYEAGAVSAASAAPIAIIIVPLVFMIPPSVRRKPARSDIASVGIGLSGFACSHNAARNGPTTLSLSCFLVGARFILPSSPTFLPSPPTPLSRGERGDLWCSARTDAHLHRIQIEEGDSSANALMRIRMTSTMEER